MLRVERDGDIRLHGLGHLLEADVTQDAGIVDDDVDGPEGIKGRLHDGLSVLDRVIVGHGLAAEGTDLLDHLVGRRRGR